jgi:hypothetical protein
MAPAFAWRIVERTGGARLSRTAGSDVVALLVAGMAVSAVAFLIVTWRRVTT